MIDEYPRRLNVHVLYVPYLNGIALVFPLSLYFSQRDDGAFES